MNFSHVLAGSAAATLLAATPALALSVGGAATVSANAQLGSTSVSAKLSAALSTAISRADQEIQRRITTLNSLNTDVQAMTKVSANEKSAIASTVATEVSNLTALKAKIDGDTDRATLKTDVKSIVDSYRIYMLVVPQGRIEVAADKIQTTITTYTSLSGKLQSRIAEAQTAGKDVTSANASLADMNAKVADANTQSQAAVSLVANLQPDQGNQTVMQSNQTALKTARADIKAALADFKTARQDAGSIVKALGAMHLNASGSASSSATVSQ